MERRSITEIVADEWSGSINTSVEKKKQFELTKASPADFKFFSPDKQRYWVFGQLVFKSNYLLFYEKDDEVIEEEDEPDSESSEQSDSEGSDSEDSESEESESDDKPNKKESKRSDNMGYGPRGTVDPKTEV